jgi:hypothetical protein
MRVEVGGPDIQYLLNKTTTRRWTKFVKILFPTFKTF